MDKAPQVKGLTLTMHRGPYQNNGATPWYSTLHIGTPKQPLKLALDSGTNITWVTSTLCAPDRCQHSSGGRFDYQASSSFSFTDCLQRPYSFGPWGTLQVESGDDVLTLNQTTLASQLLLASDYAGAQFHQLDWDGGIGFPSSSAYVDSRSTFVFEALMNAGEIDPKQPFIAFDWDRVSGQGQCQFASVDTSKTQGPHLFLPWALYSKVPGVEYIWSTPLTTYSVGGVVLAQDITFALDSGSSRFKGDDRLMRQTLKRIAQGGCPDVVLGFADGEITLGADLYHVLIEEGPDKGQTLPQFEPLGLADLVLVGSVVMEHCYTVYEYRVKQCRPGQYSLAPVGVWLYNRPDRPKIITRSSSRQFDTAPRLLACEKPTLDCAPKAQVPLIPMSAAGIWKNDYGSIMTLTAQGSRLSGSYESSTGSTGKYPLSGYQVLADAQQDHGCAITLAIEWYSLDKGSPDPSWHWTSGLCGQLYRVKGEDTLVLSHLLVASSGFPGLADAGTYLDKLTYRRVTHEPDKCLPVQASSLPKIKDRLSGVWLAADGSRLDLGVHACDQHDWGYVSGRLLLDKGETEVCGFTDINAQTDGLALQSVSLAALIRSNTTALSFSGSIDLKLNVLNVLVMLSAPTPAAHSYMQTQVKPLTFLRQEKQDWILGRNP
ncbi:avidin/streptavidin family protein [Pseudomonas weihenstephanensis]|uniref:avidin/streptavidin family protein n=1 Tax=Pseudomonas weihenstephanensis TaxID=1608994 RepID=UPI00193B0E23|nr:avidin/streptavidin family protein [Pseudomonas weihenstephanensis]MBM1193221.1 peptidase A1 pepsin [Pseudomonas weihenstephanensis]